MKKLILLFIAIFTLLFTLCNGQSDEKIIIGSWMYLDRCDSLAKIDPDLSYISVDESTYRPIDIGVDRNSELELKFWLFLEKCWLDRHQEYRVKDNYSYPIIHRGVSGCPMYPDKLEKIWVHKRPTFDLFMDYIMGKYPEK